MRHHSLAIVLPVALALLGSSTPAQTMPATKPAAAATTPAAGVGRFDFAIPWDDATPNTANDLTFLNAAPAGKFGRVIARDGHFALSDTGERIRFFGTNLAAESALPATHADADAIAASLAKRGVNLVRLHHLDNNWAIGRASLWDPSRPDRQQIDPAMLDRLDYLVSRLIAHGIYVNLNLKVGKTLSPADGFPGGAFDGMNDAFPMQKRVDHFDRRMIELQKKYARDLIAHVNPYTKRSYADEPGVALVEISNENGLLTTWPGQEPASGLDKLTEPFKNELTALWNAWLGKKYGTDSKLVAAWMGGREPLGASVVRLPVSWNVEEHEPVEFVAQQTATTYGLPDVTARITEPDAKQSWMAQLWVYNLPIEEGQAYTVSFEARSEGPRTSTAIAALTVDPWASIGLRQNFDTMAAWQRFEFPFVAKGSQPEKTRIGFQLGDSGTTLQIRNFDVRRGTPSPLKPSESVASGTVPLPLDATGRPKDDLVDFLSDTDRAYADEMLKFVREDLKCGALAYVSQVQWGGTRGFEREQDSDVIDTHGYIHHPEFPPGKDFNATDWKITNQSDLRRLAKENRSTIGDLAMWRQAGKPFTVSEIDEPAPSDYAAELLPMLAGFAAAQDWDAVYTFAVPGYGALAGGKTNAITGFFDQLNHTAKVALNPFAATVIRTNAIAPIGQRATLAIPEDAIHQTPTAEAAWLAAWPKVDPISARLSVTARPAGEAAKLDRSEGDAKSPLARADSPRGPVLKITGEKAAGLIGFAGGSTQVAGPLTAKVATGGTNFAVVTVHTLDGKPVAETSRGLVTIVGRAENKGVKWNADRTSVSNNWGAGPVQVEMPDTTVTLQRKTAAKVWALDERGNRKAEVPVRFEGGRLTFDATPKLASVWYEFAAE